MLKIATYIRYYQPRVVLSNALSDRHPDHGRAGKLISEACFYSGLAKIETTFDGKPQKAYRPQSVYHYVQDRYISPDFVVDISQVWEDKIKAIQAYKTQFYNPESNEPVTPISSQGFMDFIEGRATEFGRSINVRHGEGFTVARPVGIKQILDLI